MRYDHPKQLKLALANYEVAGGYQFWFKKNDWRELLVYRDRDVSTGRCAWKSGQPQCGFRLWASWMSTENSFQIKLLKAEHKLWTVNLSGFQELEVRQGDQSFGVNLHLKKCIYDIKKHTALVAGIIFRCSSSLGEVKVTPFQLLLTVVTLLKTEELITMLK
nr:hypothetical protein [Tanacetum cinerariifolium]